MVKERKTESHSSQLPHDGSMVMDPLKEDDLKKIVSSLVPALILSFTQAVLPFLGKHSASPQVIVPARQPSVMEPQAGPSGYSGPEWDPPPLGGYPMSDSEQDDQIADSDFYQSLPQSSHTYSFVPSSWTPLPPTWDVMVEE